MSGDDPIESKSPRIVCPECGGDVGILKDTKQCWTHRSRVLPSIVWFVFVLGILGYGISLGNWGYSKGPVELRRSVGSEFRLALVPWAPLADPDSGYLSSDQMKNAVVGNLKSLSQVRSTLQIIVDIVDKKQSVSGLQGVKFGLKERGGHSYTETEYKLGGKWFAYSWSETLQDIRDTDSIDPDRHFDWEVVEWSLFPILSYTKGSSDTTTGSSRNQSLSIHYLAILGVLSLCILIVLMIRWTGFRCGIQILERRFARYTVVAALFLSCGIGAALSPETKSSRSSITSQSTPLSSIYSIDELREVVMNPDKAAEWCRDVLALLADDQRDDFLLGQLWVFDETADKATHQMELESFTVALGYRFELMYWGRGSYAQEAVDVGLSKFSQWDWLRMLRDEGALMHRWGPPRASNFILIGIVHLALIAVSFYWIWVFFQRASRLVFGRVQRRRVHKDQCIFCCYPLTPEGLNARSSIKRT